MPQMNAQGMEDTELDLDKLSAAGSMDRASTSKRSRGLFGDIADVFTALSGGAHITRQKDGRI